MSSYPAQNEKRAYRPGKVPGNTTQVGAVAVEPPPGDAATAVPSTTAQNKWKVKNVARTIGHVAGLVEPPAIDPTAAPPSTATQNVWRVQKAARSSDLVSETVEPPPLHEDVDAPVNQTAQNIWKTQSKAVLVEPPKQTSPVMSYPGQHEKRAYVSRGTTQVGAVAVEPPKTSVTAQTAGGLPMDPVQQRHMRVLEKMAAQNAPTSSISSRAVAAGLPGDILQSSATGPIAAATTNAQTASYPGQHEKRAYVSRGTTQVGAVAVEPPKTSVTTQTASDLPLDPVQQRHVRVLEKMAAQNAPTSSISSRAVAAGLPGDIRQSSATEPSAPPTTGDLPMDRVQQRRMRVLEKLSVQNGPASSAASPATTSGVAAKNQHAEVQGTQAAAQQSPASDGKATVRRERRRMQNQMGSDQADGMNVSATNLPRSNVASTINNENADYAAEEIRPGAVFAAPGQEGVVYRTKGHLTESRQEASAPAPIFKSTAPSIVVPIADDTPVVETCDAIEQEQPPSTSEPETPALAPLAEPEAKPEESLKLIFTRGRMLIILAVLVVIVIGVGVGVAVGGEDKGITDDDTEDLDDTPDPVDPKRVELQQHLVQFSKDSSVWEDSNSPQSKALDWVLEDGESDKSRIEIRWALAVLYFSTTGDNWKETFNFLTEEHECKWNYGNDFGTSCNEENQVIGINLGASVLSIFLPQIMQMDLTLPFQYLQAVTVLREKFLKSLRPYLNWNR